MMQKSTSGQHHLGQSAAAGAGENKPRLPPARIERVRARNRAFLRIVDSFQCARSYVNFYYNRCP